MKTYKKYKDSKIEWIGEIPTEWNVARLRYRGKSIIGITYKPDEVSDETNGTLVLRSSNVQNGKLDFKDCVYVDKKIQESQLTKEGDILVCARNGSAHLVGKCAYIPKEWENVSFGAFMSIVRTDLDKFLFYYFNSQVFKGQKGLFATSTINQLTSNMLNNLDVPIPPTKDEQTAIANYLDKKTAEIDQLIADKEQLVALCQEEKTTIINQAVTKGITPNVKLKDSGIVWLGDIPEHWDIVPLKYLVEVKDGTHDSPKPVPKSEDSFPLITSKDIKDNVLNFDNCNHITREDFIKINARSNVTYNDIIMPMIGTVGGAVIVNSKIDFSIKNVALFKTSSKDSLVCSRYLKYFLDSKVIYNQFEEESRGGVQNFVALGMLRNIKVFSISESEQTEIVQHIEKESARIDAKIAKAEKYISLLTEYRTALISEVVTGKIKVID
ncbi:restriction endonuclease subunit S [Halarcobacter sp.]|uniref:restriction endonuclease subunit S n=1 Tax=Halarcobacter sp. TaxID=2321133 RepID=UPI003A90C133